VSQLISVVELAVNKNYGVRPMNVATRARMSTDERREQLLSSGVELLGRRAHDEVSIEEIAEAAGVSKGLLYHYFPTKKDFVLAALARGQEQLADRLLPDPDLEPAVQLDVSLDAFLDYVEEHATAYAAIFRRGGGGDPDIHAALDAARAVQMETMLVALSAWEDAPASTERSVELETAVQVWTFFVEGAVLRQLEHGGLERPQIRALLRTALVGAVLAAGAAAGASSRQ
jgi:AcrR family transcriptional regulator